MATENADRLKEISDRIEDLSSELRGVIAELAHAGGHGGAIKRAGRARDLLADASFAVVCAAVTARDAEVAKAARSGARRTA